MDNIEKKIHIDSLGAWTRTNTCGTLRLAHENQEALLMGWVHSRRDLGNLIFIDLRDRGGITQIVFDPQFNAEAHEKAHILRNEWVVAVKGTVTRRLEGQVNPNLPTGEIELKVNELKILNETETPPFQIDGAVDASETLKLRYRYLELRRPQAFNHLYIRHLTASKIRDFLNENDFLEVETPVLTKSTPEGARDYLVPSRVNKGMFYALPQSPQLFKQLLMVAGFDRYYQIVRCFRDEDLRADRQPEFTQVDLEMSFADEDAVMNIFEGMIEKVFREIQGVNISLPVPRMEYHEAMNRFGSDRPDLRFDMELRDATDLASKCDFQVFRNAIHDGGVVKGIIVKKRAEFFSRKILDDLSKQAGDNGAKGLVWIKQTNEGWQSPIKKFIPDELKLEFDEKFNTETEDIVLIVADKESIANRVLGAIRLDIAHRLDLIEKNTYSFLWVTKFPLLEFDETEGRLNAVHHPFTAPLEEDIHMLENEPEKVRSRAYDLVLNGAEIGGGSVRIHNTRMQQKIFQILGISEESAKQKFGFLLEALKFGAPPHAGMAIGFDRLIAIMTGAKSIRDVIAFPKTTSASCLLTDAPSIVEEEQLKELGLKLHLMKT